MPTTECTITRDYGRELCRVVTTTAAAQHPIALYFGGACVMLQSHEALRMAHALVDAVCQLRK